ncbi:hypothetical protein RND71_017337 [Anisodus tanguticus]|uniref:Short-chain dehydrogenase/reductase n=1 Tax=Anisodus tanguticus TaxID=243964 RepID=A0AAE1VFX5_9SOLA|nr:hypothetical protein RND71_017337 [Anisodus tanguticus]
MDKKERAKERKEKRRQEISLLRTIPYSDHQRWWSSETIAVVTGANRGIGFEIAHQLASHGVTVVLTSRETAVGEEAVKVLQEGGLNVAFHQLDILDPASIQAFCDWIKETYGGLDILINNAGVNFNFGKDNSVEYAEMVIQTNYFGTKNMIKALIPLMRPSPAGARIVSVTSRLGRLNSKRNVSNNSQSRSYFSNAFFHYNIAVTSYQGISNVEVTQQLEDVDKLSEEMIDNTMNTFLEQVKDGTWESGGWPHVHTDYSLSKLAVNAYTRLTARILEERPEGHKIYVNCYCPGWVKTAMTGWAGHVSPEEAADTAVWLALLPDQFVSGKFFAERREINF